ncbi:MAG: helix-turn-helix domain-containing protein [Planctomycetota bacterium]|jgi:excisionase family DNA binding protein|nr:helix-turn-helix domain-containing protein [Planctomycetota bacterium]
MNRKGGRLGKYFAAEDKRREEAARIFGGKEAKQENADILVTVDEAAEMCKVCRAAFYRMCAAGKTPARIKLGRSTRWRRQELLDWIKAGCPSREKWEAMYGKQKT